MTTTSPGAHEFPTKYLVVALAAVLGVAAFFTIAQWAGTESQPSAAPPSEAAFEASTEAVEPSAGPSGLTEALADGKLDAGFVPAPSPPVAGSGFVPETVVVSGQGGLYDALIDGKFNMDFASQNPGVQYVRGPEPTISASGLRQALADGKLDAGLIPTSSPMVAGSGFVPETVVVSGQGGLYDALIDGKFGLDFTSQNPGVQYVRGPEATFNAGGLRQALVDGKLDAGLIPTSSPMVAGSGFVPETVVVSGLGGLYDALIDGKFGLDFTSQNPGVQYVRGPEAANRTGGLWTALAEGKIDAGSTNSEPTTQPSPAALRAPTLSGGHQQ